MQKESSCSISVPLDLLQTKLTNWTSGNVSFILYSAQAAFIWLQRRWYSNESSTSAIVAGAPEITITHVYKFTSWDVKVLNIALVSNYNAITYAYLTNTFTITRVYKFTSWGVGSTKHHTGFKSPNSYWVKAQILQWKCHILT